MGDPKKASSVWPDAAFMRGPKAAQRLRELLPILEQAQRQCAQRRARVLRHEWARRRLCGILGCQSAEQWSGYVPPAKTPDGQLNTNPVRRALVDLLREVQAYERDQTDAPESA